MVMDDDHVYRGPSTVTGSYLIKLEAGCGACSAEPQHILQCPTVLSDCPTDLLEDVEVRACACYLDWGHTGPHKPAPYESLTESLVLQETSATWALP